jgi:hypothetical protein
MKKFSLRDADIQTLSLNNSTKHIKERSVKVNTVLLALAVGVLPVYGCGDSKSCTDSDSGRVADPARRLDPTDPFDRGSDTDVSTRRDPGGSGVRCRDSD